MQHLQDNSQSSHVTALFADRALCFALNLRVTEVVRDHGLEFCAELTPTELRTLDQIRQLPPKEYEAIKLFLERLTKTRIEERRARPRSNKPRRPR